MCVKYCYLMYVVWTLYNLCIIYVKLSVLSSQYFEKLFVCGLAILFLFCFCFVVAAFICMFFYFYDFFHMPLLPLQTYGSMECMYEDVFKSFRTGRLKW
jgi:hypothetical protein